MKKYKLLVCGGTFDLLHKGHKMFLGQMLDLSDEVLLGLTSDLYVKSFKNSSEIENFEIRQKKIEQFLDSINSKNRVTIISIDDIYGPLLTNAFNPEAIVVTPETENSAKEINTKRKEKFLKELEILVFSMALAQDRKVISSTRIRNGEINREGRPYVSQKWQNKTFILPQDIRAAFQEPFGKVISEAPTDVDGAKTITIGDITTQKFNSGSIKQFLSIVDFLVQRQKTFAKLEDLGFEDNQSVNSVKNPPASITPELFNGIKNAFALKDKDRNVILVEGEEDLAVLPVILVSPLGYSVFYGQPNTGLVRVNVTEEIKEKAYNLIERLRLE